MKEKHINYYDVYLPKLVQPKFDFLARRLKIDVEEWKEDIKIGEKVTSFLSSEAVWEDVYIPESTIIYTEGMEVAIADMKNNLCAVRDTFKNIKRTTKDAVKLKQIEKVYLALRDSVENIVNNRPELVAKSDNFIKAVAKQPKEVLALLNISGFTANIKDAQARYDAEIKVRKAVVNANKGKCTAQWKVLLKDMKDLLTVIDVWGSNESYHQLIGNISQSFRQLVRKFGNDKPKDGGDGKPDAKAPKK